MLSRELGGDAVLSSHLDVVDSTGRLRDWRTVLTQTFDMKLDRFANGLLGLSDAATGGDASWKVEDVRGIVVLSLLDDYGISHD